MVMGLEIRNQAGTVVFTSERPYGGCYVGTYSLDASVDTATWRFDGTDPAFPDLTGCVLRVILVGSGPHNYTTSGTVITFSRRFWFSGTTWDYKTRLMIFAV